MFPTLPSDATQPLPRTLDAIEPWVTRHRTELLAQSARDGAVLFRGLPLSDADNFDTFVAAFALPNFPYDRSLSNAVRINKTERVFTANEAPPDVSILLHHEMAQTPLYPSRLFFFCERPAEQGGATPLCRSDELWKRLEVERPEFSAACNERGLCYSNVMPPEADAQSGMGRSWRSTFSVVDRAEAERRLTELGYSWQWLDDDCLRATTPRLPAVMDLGDGRKSFFNQLIAAFHGWRDRRNDPTKAVTFGDGSSIDPADVDVAAAIADDLTIDVAWQSGDVVLVDNRVAMHGRRTFVGTRKVLASLVA